MENAIIVTTQTELRSIFLSALDEALAAHAPVPTTHDYEEYVSAKEAMRILGVGQTTLWRLDKLGSLRACRVGRNLRYRRSDIDAYLDASVAAD